MDIPSSPEILLEFLDHQQVGDDLAVLRKIATLSRLLSEGNADFAEIASVVAQSEPLALEFIAATRDAALPKPTLLESLMRLGSTRTKKLITLHSLRQIHKTFRAETPRDVHRKNVWSFSYSHALLSQRFNEALALDGDAYLPALLERMGIIIFNQFFFEPYGAMMQGKPKTFSRYDWEKQHLGYHSIEVGSLYLTHLKLGDLGAQVGAQLSPSTPGDKVRYFARHLTASKVPVFFDDIVYDAAVVGEIRQRFGPDLESDAISYLKRAFGNSLEA